jgi:hypothetical protein
VYSKFNFSTQVALEEYKFNLVKRGMAWYWFVAILVILLLIKLFWTALWDRFFS